MLPFAPIRLRYGCVSVKLPPGRVRYGRQRIQALLRREGRLASHKRGHRLYGEEGLNLRRTKRNRRRLNALRKAMTGLPQQSNECWTMDFVSDSLFAGRRLRALTAPDMVTRESLAIEVGKSLRGEDVVAALSRISFLRGNPAKIHCGNGAEFTSKALNKWAYENSVELEFSRPGRPADNAFIESFNGRFREECLSTSLFLTLADAKAKIEAWRKDYNESRPLLSLGCLAPNEFHMVASKNNTDASLLDRH